MSKRGVPLYDLSRFPECRHGFLFIGAGTERNSDDLVNVLAVQSYLPYPQAGILAEVPGMTAQGVSYTASRSILWAIIHGILGWLHVIYYALFRSYIALPDWLPDFDDPIVPPHGKTLTTRRGAAS